jgi:outer membrane immunogenic protein
MKKLLVAAAVAGLVGTANAQSAFQGFYGQLGIGYENNTVKTNDTTITGPASDPGSVNVGSQSYSGGSFSGSIGLGYGLAVSKDFLLTIGADYSPLTSNTGTKSGFCDDDGTNCATDKFKVSNRYNIFIAPGYVIDKDKLAYFKAGYSAQTVKLNGDVADAIGSPSKSLSGYVLGLGYKQIVSGGFYGFAEANYMNYSSSTLSGTTSNGYNLSSSVPATAYQFLVGVGYKF